MNAITMTQPHVVVRTNPITRMPELLRAPANANLNRAQLWAEWHRGHTRGAKDARPVPAKLVRFSIDGVLQILPA